MTATANGKTGNGKAVNRVADLMNGSEGIKLKPMVRRRVTMRIVGTSPLVQHKWSEKALLMMREKHAGKKTKNREVRDPKAEGVAATYFTEYGRYGIPAMAIKASVIGAAHRDIGIEKTLVKKALFILCEDKNGVLPIEYSKEPVIKEDVVRVGMGSTDLRYRPYFYDWSCEMTWEVDAELLTVNDLSALIDRAGFGVGILEWRPERGGEFGRFKVDPTFDFIVKEVP